MTIVYGLRRLTTPQPLLTAEEIAAYLRVDCEESPELLLALGDAATALLDGEHGLLRRALVAREMELTARGVRALSCLRLPLPPLAAILDVEAVAAGDELIAIDPDGLKVIADGEIRSLSAPEGWPPAEAIRVRYVCGYGEPEDVPPPIRVGALMLAAAMYENREASAAGLSETPAMLRILDAYRVQRL